jgi:hypothetical protein
MDIIDSTEVPEKDLPLRDDIYLLGRILGDTVREQQGDAIVPRVPIFLPDTLLGVSQCRCHG